MTRLTVFSTFRRSSITAFGTRKTFVASDSNRCSSSDFGAVFCPTPSLYRLFWSKPFSYHAFGPQFCLAPQNHVFAMLTLRVIVSKRVRRILKSGIVGGYAARCRLVALIANQVDGLNWHCFTIPFR